MRQKLFLLTYFCFAYIININGDMPKNCQKIWGTSNKINDIPVYATNIYSCTESFLDNDYYSSDTSSEVKEINTNLNFTQIKNNTIQPNNTLLTNNTYNNYSNLVSSHSPSSFENPSPSSFENPSPSSFENPSPSSFENPSPSSFENPSPSSFENPSPSSFENPSPSLTPTINDLLSDTIIKISEPSPSTIEPSSSSVSNNLETKSTLIIVLIILVSLLFVTIIVIIILYYRNKHKKTHPTVEKYNTKDLEKGTQILDSKKSEEHLKTFRSNWNGKKGKKAHHIKNTVKKQIEKNKTAKLDNLINKLKKPVTSNKKGEEKTIPKLHHGLKFDKKTHQREEKTTLKVNKKIESPTANNTSIGSELL